MISARSLVLVLALASAPLMAQETTPLEKELIVPKPLLIVPPDYPPKALAEGRTAEIRIRGTITSEGVLESPVFANSPAEEGFVQAIRAVLKMWRFIPGINSESCSAVPLGADVHVWFEITDGKPAIFVSMPAAAASKTTREGTSDPNRKIPWERRPKAAYPRSAFRAGVEGMAIVLLRVARSGEISEVNVLASSRVDAHVALHAPE